MSNIFDYFFPRWKKCEEMTDEELVSMIQAGGSERRKAINCLFQKYFELFEIKFRQHGILTEDEVLSAFSDSIVALDRNIYEGKYKGQSKLKTYFNSILEFKCIDIVRKKPTNRKKQENPGETDGERNKDNVSAYKEVSIEGSFTAELKDEDPNVEETLIENERMDELERQMREERDRVNHCIEEGLKDDKISEKCLKIIMDDFYGYDRKTMAKRHQLKNARVASATLTQCRRKFNKLITDCWS